MPHENNVLEGYSDLEKGAYLCTIASLATADRHASDDELDYIEALCDAANLSEQQKQGVLNSATDLSGADLDKCLEVLKTSELKYSLITDLMAVGDADKDYSTEEKENVQRIADYLQINQQQFSLLNEFTNKTAAAKVSPTEIKQTDFLSSLGLKDKFKNAGIDQNNLLKGLLSIAGPIILAKMVSGGLGRNGNNNRRNNGLGGLGSIISMINGGRGMQGAGGLLSGIFRKGF